MSRICFCLAMVMFGLSSPIRAGDLPALELSAKEKALIREAARPREAAPTPNPERTAAAPSTAAPAPGQSLASRPASATPAATAPMPERITRAINAHKELSTLMNRLTARRSEIERWDEAAQDKFQRAFGARDEKVRQAVLLRIDQQLQETARALAVLSDSLRLEFYLSLNKQ